MGSATWLVAWSVRHPFVVFVLFAFGPVPGCSGTCVMVKPEGGPHALTPICILQNLLMLQSLLSSMLPTRFWPELLVRKACSGHCVWCLPSGCTAPFDAHHEFTAVASPEQPKACHRPWHVWCPSPGPPSSSIHGPSMHSINPLWCCTRLLSAASDELFVCMTSLFGDEDGQERVGTPDQTIACYIDHDSRSYHPSCITNITITSN